MADPKLEQLTMDGGFRNKVAVILDTLQKKGYLDAYIVEAMRTIEQQKEKVRLGYSKTMASYHLKRGSDKKGLAADIVPKSVQWNASKRFWMMYGWLCYQHAVGWGGLFGVSTGRKASILAAMKRLSAKGWPDHDEDYQIGLGWDPAHCQAGVNW
jgi:hypothetical protein